MQQADQFVAGLLEKHPLDTDATVLVVATTPSCCLMLTLLGEPENGFRRLRWTTPRFRSSTSVQESLALRCRSSA